MELAVELGVLKSSLPLHFQVSVMANLMLLLVFLVSAICRACQVRIRTKEEQEAVLVSGSSVTVSKTYRVTLACCIYVLILQAVEVGFEAWNYRWFMVSVTALEMLSWGVMTLVMLGLPGQPHSRKRIPFLLRAWWATEVALVLCDVIVGATQISKGREKTTDISFLVGLLSLPALLYLCFVGIKGRTGIEYNGPPPVSPMSSDLLQPLLDPTEEEGCQKVTPYADAGLLSLATLRWLNPLLAVGATRPLQLKDVPMLAPKDRCETSFKEVRSNWENLWTQSPSESPSLTKALFISFWKEALVNGVFAGLNTLVSYVGPFLISYFVDYLSGKQALPFYVPHEGFLLAGIFFAAKLVEIITTRQWYLGVDVLGMHVRGALTALVYEKGMKLSSQARQSHASGEIINYMAVDVQRIGDYSWYLHDIWMLPLQIILALGILFKNVGIAAFATLIATVISILLNTPLAQMQEEYQGHLMSAKDDRMRTTSECLRNMRILKLQGWEERYRAKLEQLRNTEFVWLRKALYAQAFVTFVFWGSPIFVSVVTFGTSILLGRKLTAGGILSALATFRVLQEPLRNFPDLVSMIAQTKVSLDRISGFLQEEELPEDATVCVSKDLSEFAVEIEDGEFSWDPCSERATLSGVNLQVKKGMRVAVCGMVGAGKSSFLSCILGEIPKISGQVKICGTTAYVSQSAWIQTGNVEDNILFGSEKDKTKYKSVLQACALKKDLELFSHGDQTVIGERGINLSGGQKQRVQLARALYHDADIYLLDDPFSAVDAHTGSELFKEYILGALSSKTVIFITHQVEFLPTADLILVLRDGRIIQAGKYEELLQAGTDFETLVSAHHDAIEAMDVCESINEDSDEQKASPVGVVKEEDSKPCEISSLPLQKSDRELLSEKKRKKEKKKAKRKRNKQLVQDEERETGNVSFQVYWTYLTAAYKGALVPMIILSQTAFQVLQIGSNWWMAWASPQTEGDAARTSSLVLITVYMGLAFGSTVFVFIRALLVATFGLKAAQKLFTQMLYCIFRAPISFFDSTPAGRILSRVSVDQSVVDLDIPFRLGGFASTTIQLLGIIAVMSQVTWQVLVMFVPMAMACVWMQKYYMASSRELVRIVGIQKAPIIHHFGESISGVATIRGFGQEQRFMNRIMELYDSYARPFFYSFAAIEWLCLRMEFLSTSVFAFSLALLVSLPVGTIDASMAGLAVTYGLTLNARQSRWILSLCKLENRIISIERIHQYSRILSEAPLIIESCRPPPQWPFNGTVEIVNLQVRYKENLPKVLHGITCTFPGGKKIGIVGRTGSGKSTLIQSLFRMVEPVDGKIIIDDIDIATIGLHDLRNRLGIIPQEPTLFEGTIRMNLDPLEEHSDADIWEALDKCQLGDIVREKDLKLDSPVTENGENWSVGQRQLVSLGRALLKRARILVLDEATASVDTATDGVIQKTIRAEFGSCTVISIAHRIPTVIDSDLVLVLSDGKVAEFDSPVRLLEDKSSLFMKLVSEYSLRSSEIGSLTL
eukprot:TRINITY_DN4472_c0_g1_i2.p1 TRINITY_DN4472_c0_g1~~TRINITY_DN4472_c0_g1_i2.p1  ORF type:complete len:1511 (+),score=277.83 TRINITY_DN4472_c0_g1_i2:245-4777(+)